MRDLFSMAGRRCLITGGSVSIGRAIALGFAAHGASVAIHYSAAADDAFGLPRAHERTREEIAEYGVPAFAIEGDLADPAAPGAIMDATEAALGGVDVLVICASIQHRVDFADVTYAQIERETRINFSASIALMQRAIPPMRARKWGRVLTIGSINQVRPEPTLAVYAALKSAQANLVAAFAPQCVRDGVMINNLAPGLVETERNRWRRQDAEEWKVIQEKAMPTIGRAAQPREMVGAAILLCSDAGSYIAGADLPVSAGAHLPRAG
jgi:NAD(P)-dependent dehydrogenase (short-subunit alcohol dehydrogenase family)